MVKYYSYIQAVNDDQTTREPQLIDKKNKKLRKIHPKIRGF